MNQRNFAARFAAEHNRMPGRQFCWILGAGASVTSGIPAAATFAKKWLNEVIDRDTKQRSADQFPEIYNEKFSTHTVNWQDWNPESPAQYYSEIFDVCFASKPRDAFQEFEEAMRGKQGNIGYVILSKILTTTRHNLAITVNFDNLIANTVALHTTANLFVCGHETLVAHAASNHYIPQVFKVHRDLHTDPLNGQKLILADQWKPLLKRVFEHYSPIIVGYDGNDGTLMSFLEECDVGFTPYWCHLKWEDARPRVKQFVSKKSGYLVPIDGFDELLFCIGSKLPKLEDGTQ